MTVCVAAIAENSCVIGASDRMLTAGDVQFEPQQTKILRVTPSIAIMMAGDSGLQADIVQRLQPIVSELLADDEDALLPVVDVAEEYARLHTQARSKLASAAILAPLGLDSDTFLSRQKELAPRLVSQLSRELLNFDCPLVQTIIAGVDATGPHLYALNGAAIMCRDAVGFAAIGAGYWHSDSYLMVAGHTRHRVFSDSLLATYAAKKRAEVAPGVGEATDMFMIGPAAGSYLPIGDHVLATLSDIHRTMRAKQQEADDDAQNKVKKFVEGVIRTAAEAAARGSDEASQHDGASAHRQDPKSGPASQTSSLPAKLN